MSEPTAPDRKPQFRSDLSQTPLPEVLITVHRYRIPGYIECSRSGETKKIYIDDGAIIFASSSRREDSLGDRLLEKGIITREQYDQSARLLKETGRRQGQILAEMKAIEPKVLFVSVREQVEEIVWSVFAWPEGEVVFLPGRDKHEEFIKLHIPIPRAVLSGVRRMKDARALVARMGSRHTVFMRSERAADPGFELSAEELVLLESVDGTRTLEELTTTPALSQVENAKVLYGMFALRLIERKPPKQIKIQVPSRK
ncbi:MAG: DUF4388 domain-containing protein [Thermoanaerobaculia bacterium]